MLKRIVLENFMSHGRSEIDLASGLTVLVGPNNCGKSAVVEALRVVCTNVPSEAVVRHGAKVCRVTVETDDGHVVTWQRKGAAVSYTIDGRPVGRLGKGGVPDDLHEILRLPKVEAPGGEFDVHFGMQKEPIFLIGESGARVAAFFSVSSDAEKLMRMQGKHREKVRNAKQRKKEFEEEIVVSGRVMGAMEPLGALQEEVGKAEEEYKDLKKIEGDVKTLGGEIEDIARRMGEVGLLGARGKVLAEVVGPPVLENVGALEAVISAKQAAVGRIETARGAIGVLENVRGVPAVEDVGGVEQVVQELSKWKRKAGVLRELQKWQSQVKAPPEVMEVAGLVGMIEQVERVRGVAGARMADVLQTKEALEAVEAEMRRWAERHPVCPVCGGDVDAERLVGREHLHA